jgi:hypothetical protein
MSSRAQKIKSIVKGTDEKPTFGTNPLDPWSTKANISESEEGMLKRYLLSRGIDPRYVSKDTRISHAKSGEFLKWKNDRAQDRTPVREDVDKKDTVTFDIPLLIRVLELAREDIKSDMDLHRVVERLINMRDKGMLTMDHYDAIAQIKENHIAIAMGRMLDDEGSMVLDQLDQLERAIGMIRTYVGKDYTKQLPAWVQSKVTLGTDYIDTVGNYLSSKNEEIEIDGVILETYYGPRADKLIAHSHALHKAGDKEKSKRAHTIAMKAGERYHKNPVNRDKAISHIMSGANKDYTSGKRYTGDSVEYSDNNVISEISNDTLNSYKDKAKKSADTLHAKGQYKKSADRWLNVMKATGKQIDKLQKENSLDPMGATETTCSCANNPDDVSPKGKRLLQMSKSARMIKSIYKHHRAVKEDTYDTEKDDKSIQTYGKKPKVDKMDKDAEPTKSKVQAAAVLSGGTTLTGEKRDTVEIDPIMRVRPGQPDPTKNEKK